jgi:hypothetical protein
VVTRGSRVTDDLSSLSSGDLAVHPADGDVWYATGDAAQGNYSRSYRGVGVFRSMDKGENWELMGGDQLDQTLIGALELDGEGQIYAATTAGLYRRRPSSRSTHMRPRFRPSRSVPTAGS